MTGKDSLFCDTEFVGSCHMTSKQRNVLTGCLLISFFGLGMVRGQEGVVFLDLLIIIRENLETGSLLFLFSALGFLVGALVGGILYDRLDALLVFTCCVVFLGLFCFVIPFCQSFVLMGLMLFCRSVFAGGMDSGGTFLFVRMWKFEANPYIQALRFTFATGALAVPFITEPFLAPGPENNNNNSEPLLSAWNTTLDVTVIPISDNSKNTTFDNVANYNLSAKIPDQFRRTDVYISFLIVGPYILAAAIPLVCQVVLRAKKVRSESRKDLETKMVNCPRQEPELESRKSPLTYNIMMYVLIVLLFAAYGCLERSCASFLMPFAVEYTRWDKIKAARLMACFWGSFAASRFLGIGVAKVTTEFKMLLGDYVSMMGGFCVLLLTAIEREVVVWCAVVIVGLALGGVFPTSTAWINKEVSRVTGVISGVLIVSVAGGSMVYLPLLGYLFQEYSPVLFIYLSIGITLLCSLSFIGLVLLSRSSMRSRIR